MFNKIRKCLDEFENHILFESKETDEIKTKNIFDYFDLHLAEALMSDLGNSDRVAKIILASKGLSSEIKIKFVD